MDLEPRNFCNLLLRHIQDESNGPDSCFKLLSIFNTFLTTELQDASLIVHLFHKSHGLLKAIEEIASKKSFQKCLTKALEIVYVCMNNFSLKLESSITDINNSCLVVIGSFTAQYTDKIRAFDIIILGFEKIPRYIENTDHYVALFEELKRICAMDLADSVHGKALETLGMYIKIFYYAVEDEADNLKLIFINELERDQHKSSGKILAGLYLALNGFSQHFPFDPKADVLAINLMYKSIERLATVATNQHNKVSNRAALQFFSKNMHLFVARILQDYKKWHHLLKQWLDMGLEEKKCAWTVLESFYQNMALIIAENSSNDMLPIITYFMNYFERIIFKTKDESEKKTCLRGLSAFAKVYYQHVDCTQVSNFYLHLMRIFQESFVIDQNPTRDTLDNLPEYLKLIACFMQFKTSLTSSDLFCLQRAVIVMIKAFPVIIIQHQILVIDAFVRTTFCLKTNNTHKFKTFLNNVIYQGIIWSCSHPYWNEVDEITAESSDVITVKKYYALWRGLLRVKQQSNYEVYGIDWEQREFIFKAIVTELINSFLILINKLNVNIVLMDSNSPLTSVETSYKVEEINDFAIFLNLVDLYVEIFNSIEPQVLDKCICKLVTHLIAQCIQHPFISGFYKLLSCCLRLLNQLHNFDDDDLTVDDETVKNCHETLLKFLKELFIKTKQFKDELLIACLNVILNFPIAIIKDFLTNCIPVFTIIFHIGRNDLSLANAALDTLEKWQSMMERGDLFDEFLSEILPLLDNYLQSKFINGFIDSPVEKRRKTAQVLKKRKVIVEIEPELIKLQKKILNFVGHQDSFLCKKFVSAENNVDLIFWSDEQRLKIVLPLDKHNLDLYLDKFLPRIVNLALYCSDRKMRMAACEVLHAVVMIFLAETKQMGSEGKENTNQLWKFMVFPLLKLGCDSNQVIQQLYNPLFLQLTHWYTHFSNDRNEHTAIVIEAMMDGISDPSDSALRDFSGKCLNEFIKWTIKQSSEERLAHDPINIKVLLKHMWYFSTHPDPSKKMASALIFNNIYKVLREETSLLSGFWLEFLYLFVKSLSLIESTCEDEIVKQLNIALNNVQRGLVEKAHLFNKNDDEKRRRVPYEMKGGLLKDAVIWVCSQINSNSLHCRKKCIELFCKIAPCTSGFTTLSAFFDQNINNRENWIQETFEQYISKYPTLDTLSQESNSLILLKWMRALLCILDGYIFLIKNNLIDFTVLQHYQTLLTVLQYYIRNLSTIQIADALALIKVNTWTFSYFDRQEFNNQKSLVVYAIFTLIDHILNIENNELIVESLFTNDLYTFLINSLFKPEDLGFDLFTVHNHKELINNFGRIVRKMPPKQTSELIMAIEIYIEKCDISNIDLKHNIGRKHRNAIQGLLYLQSLTHHFISLDRFRNGLVEKLLTKFSMEIQNEISFADNLQDTTISYCASYLEFALFDPNEFKIFLNWLYQPYDVHLLENSEPITFGLYLLNLFEDVVMKVIASNFEVFIESSNSRIKQFLEFCSVTVNYILKDRKKFGHCVDYVIKQIVENWPFFEEYLFENMNTLENGIDLIKRLIHPIRVNFIQCGHIKNFLVVLLNHQEDSYDDLKNLNFKMQILELIIQLFNESDGVLQLGVELGSIKEKYFSNNNITIPIEFKTTFLDKLLGFLVNVQHPDLLLFLLDTYVTVFQETDSINITVNLINFAKNSKIQLQQQIFIKVFEKLTQDSSMSLNEKYRLMITVTPFIQNCLIEVINDFFNNNINGILTSLQESITEENLVMKIINLILLELLFLKVPLKSDDENVISIVTSANYSTNKQFIQACLKLTLNTCKDSIQVKTTESNDFLKLYYCHGYNALVSIVSNSINNINFYMKLFTREENGEDILWRKLIDTETKYSFSKDFDTFPKKRKFLINIRDELKQKKREQQRFSSSAKYLETQRVYNSSLTEDFTRFDFTHTLLRAEDADKSINQNVIQTVVELDLVDVNTHLCMATVCGLIQNMIKEEIVKLNDREDENTIKWIEGIKKILLSPTTPNNIKIFWIKVIDNNVDIFKHFASSLLEPLLKFVIDKCAGNELNYFVVDVIAILASWSTDDLTPSTANEKHLINELVTFIVTQIDNERQDIFKYHLELLKLMIEAWKSIIIVPYDTLFLKLEGNIKARKVDVGIHISAIFLANNIPIWNSLEKFGKFCGKIANILLTSDTKSTYKPCAETLGLILKLVNHQQNITKVLENINKILLEKITNFDKYISCLEGITLHYPQIATRNHLIKIMSKMNCVNSDLKVIFLKILLKRTEEVLKINDFLIENWEKHLESDKLDVQFLTLELIYKCLNTFRTSRNFLELVNAICRHASSANVMCRSRIYDILILLGGSESEFLTLDTYSCCKSVLIQGLTDDDEEINEKVVKFWENQADNIHSHIENKCLYVLTHLYSQSTENQFLGYSTYFLLRNAMKNSEFNKKMFDYPLEDCNFETYKLETNWRKSQASIIPMFAETLRGDSWSPPILNNEDVNLLRQTQQQSMEFSPTQSMRLQEFSQFTSSQSSLAIMSDRMTDGFVDPNKVLISQAFRKRRFLRDKSIISRNIARSEIKKSFQKIEKRIEKARERDNKITVYREYRKGDFPDTQIAFSAFLQPMMVLILHDYEISKVLFSQVFNSILKKMSDSAEFINNLTEAIKIIFTSSSSYNQSLFRTLFDILLMNNKFIKFNSDVVTTICEKSELLTFGALLIEEYLLDLEPEPSTSKRRRTNQLEGDTVYWVKLAELYKEMGEWEVVRAIYLSKIDSSELVRETLVAETNHDWQGAKEGYYNLIESSSALDKRDFYYESYFNCFAEMGDWQHLSDYIHDFTGSWNDLWDGDWNQRKLLPWYINAKLRDGLSTGRISTEFFGNLNETLNSENCNYLQSHFTLEMCLLLIYQKDISLAKELSTLYMDNFLESWQVLDPIYTNLRLNRIFNLCNIVDVNQLLNWSSNISDDSDLDAVLSFWEKNSKGHFPSILTIELRVLYRAYFLNLLQTKLSNNINEDVIRKIKKIKFDMELELIDIAIERQNFYLARNYFQKIEKLDKEKLDLCSSRILTVKSDITDLEFCENKIAYLLESTKVLGDLLQSGDNSLKLLAMKQRFDNLNRIYLLSINPNNASVVRNKADDIQNTVGFSISSPSDIAYNAANELYTRLKMFEQKFKSFVNSGEEKILCDSYVKLALQQRQQENSIWFVECVLSAMKLGSEEARKLFPCILLRTLSDKDKRIFIEQSELVPTWMFLEWVPQLFANINSNNYLLVSPILIRLAKAYPQAVMYAYRLWKNELENNKQEHENFIQQLDQLLLNESQIDSLLLALSYVCVPAAILLYYIQRLHKKCIQKDADQFKLERDKVIKMLFTKSGNSKNIYSFQGNEYKKIDKYQSQVNKLKESKWDANITILTKLHSDVTVFLKNDKEHKKHSKYLKDYSPWLMNFVADKLNLDIEIPGQYDGRRKPLIYHHVKISGFKPNVSVMNSIRKPIKITILGNNSKEYPFLVKFGEDVRQDQRVQQISNVVNDLFRNDATNNVKDLTIETYQVVPLSTNLGIIQWITDTKSLYDFAAKSVESIGIFEKAMFTYVQWIYGRTQSNQTDTFGKAMKKFNRAQTEKKFKELINIVPWDIYRKSFQKLSINTETFFAIRNNFIKSYAVMCVSHWILGIGDRHLSNSLILEKNGKVLGIDFGHAFGTATELLGVPELVPFRLTPHIVNLLEPIGVSGLFREIMMCSLEILRANKLSLLATLHVFIKDPSLDWFEYASRFADSDKTTYLYNKLERVKEKLEGYNPATIMEYDLKLNQKIKNYLNDYLQVLRGTAEHNCRARKCEGPLSIANQVDMLIDHATDYNILGRMFNGWQAWI